jgi:hypothetical protein
VTDAIKTLRKVSALIAKRDKAAEAVRQLDHEISLLTRIYEQQAGYRMLQPHHIRNMVKQQLGAN